MNFFGHKLRIKVCRMKSLESSYYDPSRKILFLNTGICSRLMRSLIGRSDQWLLGHELAHAFADQCSPAKRRKLEALFGSFAEDRYNGSGAREFWALIGGFDRTRYPTARASLCAEEAYCEFAAYLYAGGDPRAQPGPIRRKLCSLQRILRSR